MERGVHFSGNANNGSNAGFVYANSNNTPSNTNANIGSRKCFQQCKTNIYITCGGLASWQKIYAKTISGAGKESLCIGY